MNNKFFHFLLLGGLILGFINCTSSEENQETYIASVEAWHQQRAEQLIQPDSWLALAGLFWLADGLNNFGSDTSNQIVFPKKSPAFMGGYSLIGDSIGIKINDSLNVYSEEHKIQEWQGVASSTPNLKWNDLAWYLIKRGDRYGIRLRDAKNEAIEKFTGIEHFPISKNWQIEGVYEPYDSGTTIKMENVLGMNLDVSVMGSIQFSVQKKSYKLEALDDGGELFLIFSDETTGHSTYGAGRYLHADYPKTGSNLVVLDFNKAYNPPCAFTPYATCLLPPEQNHLPFELTAGEKDYGEH